MKRQPKLSILRGLLFTYDIENIRDLEREEIIASKNVNDRKELIELFDTLTMPEFFTYTKEDQKWFVDTISHYLSVDESFDSVFYLFDTYFDDEIIDQRQFMKTLLECLTRYHAEAIQNESKN
ncbi:hypothetical protein GIR22_24810 [Pseudomonas sp. CCM 7891]|uniref:CdiI immunity protein domain-containing protein n=1 Tax=Pseudomonas karstica TaxID=1055468 RepID=A0A7X2RWX2_9PSED|nr:hypothetical protein [Pseudomonas karstica]MTD22354.1 hypothetical protein [Pseudomonas karstica]